MYYPDEFEEEQAPMTLEEFNHAKDHLQGLIEDVYNTGSIEDLQFHLEEVLSVFWLKVPESEPVIMKKLNSAKRTEQTLKAWLGLNKQYAESFIK